MKRFRSRKIPQLIATAILCVGISLIIPGHSSNIFATENATQEGYSINLHDAVYTEGTYWFAGDKIIEIKAESDYTISTTLDEVFSTELSYTYPASLPSSIYLKNTNGEVTGPIAINISWDTTAPVGEITFGSEYRWQTLDTSIGYELAIEKGVENSQFTIATGDNGGSGVASVQYYIANYDLIGEEVEFTAACARLEQEIENAWIALVQDSQTIDLQETGENVIYVKLTDNVGNVTYISSTGVVLYDTPAVSTDSLIYTKEGTDIDPSIDVDLRGNMFDGDIILTDASGQNVMDFTAKEGEADTTWGYHNADGKITFNRNFFDGLAGKMRETQYTITIKYVPLKEQYPDLIGACANVEFEPTQIKLIIKNTNPDLSEWGEAVSDSGKNYYVDDSGKTSVEILSSTIENGLIWLPEESAGERAWYALDVSGGAYPMDSTYGFYVHWLETSKPEYSQLYNQMDESKRNEIDTDKNWIFKIGVNDVNGTKIQPSRNVKIYIQLDDSWDKDDIKAYAIAGQEEIRVSFVENMAYPNGTDDFAVLELEHFSPYVIYQAKEVVNTPPTNTPIYYYPIYNEPTGNEVNNKEPEDNESQSKEPEVSKPEVSEQINSEIMEAEPEVSEVEPIGTEQTDVEENSEVDEELIETNAQTQEVSLGISVYLIGAILVALLLFGWVKYKN